MAGWSRMPVVGDHGQVGEDGFGRWFAEVELGGSPAAGRRVLAELVGMLDRAQPALLDPARSTVRSTVRSKVGGHAHGAGIGPAVDIRLAHRTDDHAAIDIAVGEQEATVAWLTAHEHVDIGDGSPERDWTVVVVDLTAAIISGQYEVQTVYRGRRPIKIRIIDTAGEQPGRVVSTSGNLLSLLPSLRRTHIERTRLDYGTRPS